MIRYVSGAFQRGNSHKTFLRMAQRRPLLPSLLEKTVCGYSRKKLSVQDVYAENKLLAKTITTVENNKEIISTIVKEILKDYKKDLKTDKGANESMGDNQEVKKDHNENSHGSSNHKTTLGERLLFFLLNHFFKIIGAILVPFLSQHGYTILSEIKEIQLKNYKVKKGQQVQEYQDSQLDRRIKRELEEFQCKDTHQQTQITEIVNFLDNKSVQYIEAFVGNGFTTNLLRHIDRKIQNEKKQGKSSKFIIYDFKEPSKSGSTDDDNEWGQASKLHHLLTNLIEKEKGDKSEKKYLIINQVNLLANSFKRLKSQQLQELLKQIIYLNKQKIAKVILISENHYFYDSCQRQCSFFDLQDFKRCVFKQLSDEDLRKVVKSRMAYDRVTKLISTQDKQKVDEIIEFIMQNNNSVKESMSILKAAKLDAKSQYDQYRNQKHSKQMLESFLNDKFAPSIRSFKQKYDAAKIQCSKIILAKQDHLQKSIGISDYKNLDGRTIQRLKKVQYHKSKLLDDILHKRYSSIQQKSSFYLDYDDAKLQAFRELNDDEILHGFEFVSKSTALAYKQAVNTNPHCLSMMWFWRMVRWFEEQ